ncbi:MAG: tyrosine--tRNA ligase [Euryarchaeota archaeon]|nr:tyrosine--tRNA ligase [Euryarchaeota archaeon]MCD6158527.1 tyrosine--tRNA ligase [Euryarchaeota archaeon]
MDVDKFIELVTRGAEEVITVEEIKEKFLKKRKLRAYQGFEPSGLGHIGWLVCVKKLQEFIEAGVETIVFLADWHAYINDKLGGSLENIRTAGEYLREAFEALGLKGAKYIYASELVDSSDYWALVLKVAKNSTLARIKRALTIMGRREDEAELDFSKLIYPAMQVADIFYMKIDIAYGGMDQRKAHMLARDIAEKLGIEKPVALHTPLLPSLQAKGRMDTADVKMSKSNPEAAVLIHDDPEDVRKKILAAYCPAKQVDENPVLKLYEYIIFRYYNEVTIKRPEKYGGAITYNNYDDLKKDFSEGKIHPLDLKENAARYVNEILDPVREYFKENPENYKRVRKLALGS